MCGFVLFKRALCVRVCVHKKKSGIKFLFLGPSLNKSWVVTQGNQTCSLDFDCICGAGEGLGQGPRQHFFGLACYGHDLGWGREMKWLAWNSCLFLVRTDSNEWMATIARNIPGSAMILEVLFWRPEGWADVLITKLRMDGGRTRGNGLLLIRVGRVQAQRGGCCCCWGGGVWSWWCPLLVSRCGSSTISQFYPTTLGSPYGCHCHPRKNGPAINFGLGGRLGCALMLFLWRGKGWLLVSQRGLLFCFFVAFVQTLLGFFPWSFFLVVVGEGECKLSHTPPL